MARVGKTAFSHHNSPMIPHPSSPLVPPHFKSFPFSVTLSHKVRTYKEYHSVCPSSELGLPPTPQPQASVPPGGEHSLARKGLGESQFRRGAYTVVLFICTYFVHCPLFHSFLHYFLYFLFPFPHIFPQLMLSRLNPLFSHPSFL